MPDNKSEIITDNLDEFERAKTLLNENQNYKIEIQQLSLEFSSILEEIKNPKLTDINNYFIQLQALDDNLLSSLQSLAKKILETHSQFIDNFIALEQFEVDNSSNSSGDFIDLISAIKAETFPDLTNLELIHQIAESGSLPPSIINERRESLNLQASFFARRIIQDFVGLNPDNFKPLRAGEADVVQLGARIYPLENENKSLLDDIVAFDFINTPNDLYDNIHSLLQSFLIEGQRPSMQFTQKFIPDPYSPFDQIGVPVLQIKAAGSSSQISIDFSDYFIPRLYNPKTHSYNSTELFDSYDSEKAKREIETHTRNFKQENFTKELLKDFGAKIEHLSKMPSSFISRLSKNHKDQDVKILNKLKAHILSLQMDETSQKKLRFTFDDVNKSPMDKEELNQLKADLLDIDLENMSFVLDSNGEIVELEKLSEEDKEYNSDIKGGLELVKIDLSLIVDKLIELN